MPTATELTEAARRAWSSVPAPSDADMKLMAWGWGDAAAEAFVGVVPMSVDTTSAGFYAATPLSDEDAEAMVALAREP